MRPWPKPIVRPRSVIWQARFLEGRVDRLDVLAAPHLVAVEIELLEGAAPAQGQTVVHLVGEVEPGDPEFVVDLGC